MLTLSEFTLSYWLHFLQVTLASFPSTTNNFHPLSASIFLLSFYFYTWDTNWFIKLIKYKETLPLSRQSNIFSVSFFISVKLIPFISASVMKLFNFICSADTFNLASLFNNASLNSNIWLKLALIVLAELGMSPSLLIKVSSISLFNLWTFMSLIA